MTTNHTWLETRKSIFARDHSVVVVAVVVVDLRNQTVTNDHAIKLHFNIIVRNVHAKEN